MFDKSKAHPIATAAFYEMMAAFFVLLLVFVMATTPAGKGITGISMIIPAIGCWTIARGIRRGEIAVPRLGENKQGEKEYGVIRNVLTGSVILAAVLTATLIILISQHRLTGGWAIATFIVFNLYGWFTHGWWRETYRMMVQHRARQKALQVPFQQTEPITYARKSVVPEPQQLHVGNGSNP